MQIVVGIILVLHGLVHLLYLGQSARLFHLRPEMTWPEGSWAFSNLLGDSVVRSIAGVSLGLAAVGFVVGGIALFASQAWWRPLVVGWAVFSALIFVFMWDGQAQALSNKGLFAILINLVIVVAILIFKWPNV